MDSINLDPSSYFPIGTCHIFKGYIFYSIGSHLMLKFRQPDSMVTYDISILFYLSLPSYTHMGRPSHLVLTYDLPVPPRLI